MGKGITYSTSGRDCPCCGCQERAVGCHGKCDQYKAWDGKRQAEKLERFRKTSLLHEADKRKSAAVSHLVNLRSKHKKRLKSRVMRRFETFHHAR